MSKKNSLEMKQQRKALKNKDRGYPSFYEQVKNKKEDIMTLPLYLRKMFYSNVLTKLGLNTKEVADAEPEAV